MNNYNYNSNKNQSIKKKFVENEVFGCVSGMVDYILKKSWDDRDPYISIDDIINYYPDNSDEIEELNEKIKELEGEKEDKKEQIDQEYDKKIDKIRDRIVELENEQEEPNEIFEYWIVSSWLLVKLKEHGQPVIEHENIWGRCCTGQAIFLDGVISQICYDLEILEGQKNEWNV